MFKLTPFNRRAANRFRALDDFENNFFSTALGHSSQIRCDISEEDGNYLLEADLPGFDEDNINIEIDGDYLTISAVQSSEEEEKDDDGKFLRRERRFGSFTRRFDVSNIETDAITADYKNGVLALTMPIKEDAKPAVKRIEISTDSDD